jgi:hypothetical protein
VGGLAAFADIDPLMKCVPLRILEDPGSAVEWPDARLACAGNAILVG